MNRVWHVRPRPGRGIVGILRDRFWPFIIVGIGSALVLSSLVLSTLIQATSAYVDRLVPSAGFVWHYVDLGLSFTVVTVLFAMVYKFLPDARVAWSDVWIGALVTSALFSLGKYAFSLYLGTTAIASVYGAAGSFLLVLVWVYFSTSILLLGAEFTHVYAERHGNRVIPKKHAVQVD
jgi:membrane protein